MGAINKKRVNQREKYKLSNWSSYNESLKKRGKITIWLSNEIKSGWVYGGKNKPGGKVKYGDLSIEFCLVMKYLYGLAYRQTEGFVDDLFKMLKIELPVPSYTQINRRSKNIEVDIRIRKRRKENLTVVIDSTGLKVYGEGEWKVRKHGISKRRTWRKLHIGSDGNDLEILSVILTGNDIDDATAGVEIINEIEEQIEGVAADGAYDKIKFRNKIPSEIIQLIPPQKNAVLSKKGELKQRDEAVKQIKEIGREKWKKEVGYHIRSLSEVNMFRFKKAFTHELKSRETKYEQTEVSIKCKILNKFVEIGMPKSYKVS